ncbi:ATP-dependent DNA helicase [Corynebacterium timonense]|uniref:DNA 3'-5' helicase n=1 Tax=Corynebacterium timonense TaxID=441500 RepID=A0A1H1RQ20_9CORY|nr:ATP-dependent DNA helicase [Corynebacterium timonense]SDS37109.1 Superfamily I DNA or RNA helicase [Corynebacterium timonense]
MESTAPVPVTPTAFLVPRPRATVTREWGIDIPRRGTWKVTGEAGSGVSSFLVDTAVRTIKEGADPSGVVLLTASKESASRLRTQLSDLLTGSGFVADAPLVRSIHSLAFALVRQQASEQIRLISGAEQDAVFRQLLQGHAEDGRGTWPAELRPALGLVGFARQLRDFLLRAVERRLGPEELAELGRIHRRPIWSAAADFLREYQQVMALSGARNLSASELVSEALRVPWTSPWHTVLVDDAQHLDPAAAELARRLVESAHLGIVAGDEEQSVFRFRGASPDFLRTLGGLDHQVIGLGETRRAPARHAVRVDSSATQNAVLVDRLRRANLEDNVPYREMAVVVRSTGMLEPVRRALVQAGVPAALNPTDVVLSEQRIVASLLLGLRALNEELAASEWRELLLGPVGGTDPVTLRRLLRGLRRWEPGRRAEETLREILVSRSALPDFGEMLTDRELDILTHTRGILDAGRAAQEEGGTVEEVLWAVWNATGLSNRLLAEALRGGAGGSQADRDLDAVMALFDAAGDFTERRASAGVDSFVTYTLEQVLPTGVRDRRTATPDAVALLTAHGVAGREFRRVIVAGVQEESWPSLGETGTIFGQEDLVDLIDNGVDPAVPVTHKAERLKEERRLFQLATSRATDEVLVTAVDVAEGDEVIEPSRFVDEFCTEHGIEAQDHSAADYPLSEEAGQHPGQVATLRVLAHDELIAELRRSLAAEGTDEATRRQAARQLARLAEAGVPGADPGQWWTVTEPSTREALPQSSRLSPSRIESLLQCPMRSVLERMVGLDSSLNMVWGSIAHAYFEAVGNGVDEVVARRAAVEARRQADDAPAWKAQRDVEEFEAMLGRANEWLRSTRGTFEQVAVEADVNVEVAPQLRIVGRVDRVEREPSGAYYVVDLKTGSSIPSAETTRENAQLHAYQLALSRGVVREGAVVTATEGDTPLEVGGAVLLYPKKASKKPTTREQARKTPEELDEFVAEISPLPAEMTGPELTARAGEHCTRCAVRALCPVQPEGQVITHA